MAATKYFITGVTTTNPTTHGIPAASQSSALNGLSFFGTSTPVHSSSDFGTFRPSSLTVWGCQSGQTPADYASNATTSAQGTFIARAHRRIGSGDVGGGTWNIAALSSEGNGAANAYFALSIYVWNPVGLSVRGFIYDATTQLGGTEADGAYQVFSVTGSSVTAQNGDYVVVELWAVATQSMATAYINTCALRFYDTGFSLATEGSASTTCGYFEAPDALPAYSAVVPSLVFPRRDSRIVPLI